MYDWVYLELADLDAGDFDATFPGIWTRGLLIRRNIADGDLAFFSTSCPIGTPVEKLVMVEGHRWAIEDSFETAKNKVVLDHNETRSWHGWHTSNPDCNVSDSGLMMGSHCTSASDQSSGAHRTEDRLSVCPMNFNFSNIYLI